MTFCNHTLRGLVLMAVLLPVLVSSTFAQSNVTRSPFLPAGSASSGPGTENAPLEYRGLVSTKSGAMFALYDPSKHQSVWARLNEPGSDFVVKSNDPKNDTITVDYQGRLLTLALKETKVETMTAIVAPAVAPVNPGIMRGPPPGVNGAPTPADEARRLEAVAAEVRRRRMLRAQAQGMPQNQAPVMPGQVPR